MADELQWIFVTFWDAWTCVAFGFGGFVMMLADKKWPHSKVPYRFIGNWCVLFIPVALLLFLHGSYVQVKAEQSRANALYSSLADARSLRDIWQAKAQEQKPLPAAPLAASPKAVPRLAIKFVLKTSKQDFVDGPYYHAFAEADVSRIPRGSIVTIELSGGNYENPQASIAVGEQSFAQDVDPKGLQLVVEMRDGAERPKAKLTVSVGSKEKVEFLGNYRVYSLREWLDKWQR